MKFKVNDLVRVKSFEEIKKTLDSSGYYRKMFFNPEMKSLCSKTFKVKEIISSQPFRVRLKKVDGDRLDAKDWWVWDTDWLESAEGDKRNVIFPIDVSDLEKAIEEVKRFHHETSKHRLTNSQMKIVKQLMGTYAVEAIEKGCSIVFYVNKLDKRVTLHTIFGDNVSDFAKQHHHVYAYCSSNNEFNPTVGKFVCLCKLLGKTIPEWI